jgi:hypothetical protein
MQVHARRSARSFVSHWARFDDARTGASTVA